MGVGIMYPLVAPVHKAKIREIAIKLEGIRVIAWPTEGPVLTKKFKTSHGKVGHEHPEKYGAVEATAVYQG